MLINDELIHSAWHLCYTAEGNYLYEDLDSSCGWSTGKLESVTESHLQKAENLLGTWNRMCILLKNQYWLLKNEKYCLYFASRVSCLEKRNINHKFSQTRFKSNKIYYFQSIHQGAGKRPGQ